MAGLVVRVAELIVRVDRRGLLGVLCTVALVVAKGDRVTRPLRRLLLPSSVEQPCGRRADTTDPADPADPAALHHQHRLAGLGSAPHVGDALSGQHLSGPHNKPHSSHAATNFKHWFTTSFLQTLPYLVTPSGLEDCQLTSSILWVLKQW